MTDDKYAIPGHMSGNPTIEGQFIQVEGLRTHFFEQGTGPCVLLLHGGEFGCCAEISWDGVLPKLSSRFRVIAPDWLGFGRSAKIYDFEAGSARRFSHMQAFIRAMHVDEIHIVGTSMGGTSAAQLLSTDPSFFPAKSLALIGAGGPSPDNEYRKILVDYDGSLEGMRGIISVLMHDQSWAKDDAYVQRRHELSLIPGTWECTAAARFRNPGAEPRKSIFGGSDRIEYEGIEVPTLVIAGADDRLKPVGYADEIARRLPDGKARVLDHCGHSANVERAADVVAIVGEFIAEAEKHINASKVS